MPSWFKDPTPERCPFCRSREVLEYTRVEGLLIPCCATCRAAPETLALRRLPSRRDAGTGYEFRPWKSPGEHTHPAHIRRGAY